MTARAPKGRASRSRLLAAANALLRESGYAAVTSRRIAERAGLKPQLIHYYFRTMDDLFIALYHDYANALIARQEAALDAPNPLRAMWQVTTEAHGPVLTEFLALANHRKAIQSEIATLGARYRQSQLDAMGKLFEKQPPQGLPTSPALATMLLNSLARSLAVENEFAITGAHTEVETIVEGYLRQYDPPQGATGTNTVDEPVTAPGTDER